MFADLKVTVEGWWSDHEDDGLAVLDPVYAVLDDAKRDGLLADYNCSEFPQRASVGGDVEDPVYVFTLAGVTDIAEVRRRAYVLASSTGPGYITDCEVA